MASLRKANSGSFKVGNLGGGRPRGARSRLHELAIEMLRADFEQHGEEVIRCVRERKPEVYLASIVSMLPRQKERIESPFIDISNDELQQLEEHLTEVRAKTIKRLELVAGKEVEPKDATQFAEEEPKS
jgi:flagellar biosynthesis/type III secretory pathway protein FliH